ncbi:MAG: hypothetical protein II871_03530 [Clostridia bacterium]|nr:hypothetical protein [Clostridia bacterium]
MRSFELVYELKQQTPIIHFQYAQKGAALRATEVKPKLDRYIAKQYWKLTGASIPKKWLIQDGKGALAADAAERTRDKRLIPDEKGALNYRMVIKSEGEEHVELGRKTPYDIYYGNSGRDKPILGSKSKKLSLKLICTVRYKDNRTGKTLLEFMNEMIPSFFITHNFGSMQRKGFGSYVIGSPDRDEIAKALTEHYGASRCYAFDVDNDDINGDFNTFARIKHIYSIIKSGVNLVDGTGDNHGRYRRSLLFLYMHERQNISNEKAWLKQNNMAPTNVGLNAGAWHRPAANHPSHYVRAILGVGEKLEFRNSLDRENRSKTIVKIKSDVIGRLKSPIFFKVIGNVVYYIGEQINPVIFGQDFVFTSRGTVKNLTVPAASHFDIADFLEYCYEQLNYSSDDIQANYPGSGYKALRDFPLTRGVRIRRYEGGSWA